MVLLQPIRVPRTALAVLLLLLTITTVIIFTIKISTSSFSPFRPQAHQRPLSFDHSALDQDYHILKNPVHHHTSPSIMSDKSSKVFSPSEVSTHNHDKSAWVIIEGKVYDVTDFLDDHPGGKKILLENCGKDATEYFHEIHTREILENVGGPMMIGQVTGDANL